MSIPCEELEYLRSAVEHILGQEKVAADLSGWSNALRNHRAAAGAVGVGGAALVGVPGLGGEALNFGRRIVNGVRKYIGLERNAEQQAQQAAQQQMEQSLSEGPEPDEPFGAPGMIGYYGARHTPDFTVNGVEYWDPYAFANEDRYHGGESLHTPDFGPQQQGPGIVHRTLLRNSDDVLRAAMMNSRRLVRR